MTFSISAEVYIFLWSVFAGVCISVLFDLFRLLRKNTETDTFLSAFHDILFWLMASTVMFFVVFYSADGRLRWYQFFGAFLGSIIYFLALSRLFLTIFGYITQKIYKFFKLFFKILLTPLRFMYKIVYVSLSLILKPFKSCFRVIKKYTLKSTKHMHLLFTKK